MHHSAIFFYVLLLNVLIFILKSLTLNRCETNISNICIIFSDNFFKLIYQEAFFSEILLFLLLIGEFIHYQMLFKKVGRCLIKFYCSIYLFYDFMIF